MTSGSAGSNLPLLLSTVDGCELEVDRQLLSSHSKVFKDILEGCDSSKPIRVEESREVLSAMINLLAADEPPPETFTVRSAKVWDTLKSTLEAADKYDIPLLKERCEKWLVFRLFRLKMDGHALATPPDWTYDWLVLCQKHGLKELGRFMAAQLGESLLPGGAWAQQLHALVEAYPAMFASRDNVKAMAAAAMRKPA